MAWISTKSNARRHGAYAIERTAARIAKATGTGCVAIVEQFPWGPENTVYLATGVKDAIDTFAPPGMNHLGSGYMALTNKGFPDLRVVRVLPASGAVAASYTLMASAVTVATVTAKYKGAAGNAISLVVGTASDGDVNHFNLTATVTSASGTTSEVYPNINVSGTGADSIPSVAGSKLLASITKVTGGRPTSGTYSLASGADGSVAAADYVGTAGTGNKGIALLEGDKNVRVVTVGDPGSSFRAVVNAGLVAHATLMGDRVCIINGDSGQTAAQAITNVATYTRSNRVVYAGNWYYTYDDVTGAEQLVPPGPMMASLIAQTSPSTSIAWKDAEQGLKLSGINRLEVNFGAAVADCTDAGIACFITEDEGGFRVEAGVTTIAPADPSKKNLTRTRIGDYFANSLTKAFRPFGDSPNVEANRIPMLGMTINFMDGLKQAAKTDPNHTPHVLDYTLLDPEQFNSTEEIAAGDNTIPLDVKTSAAQERIFLSTQFGEGVVIVKAK